MNAPPNGAAEPEPNAAAAAAAPAAGFPSWPWYVGGLIVGTALLWTVLHLARVGGGGTGPSARAAVLLRGVLALAGASAVVAMAACFSETKARRRRRMERLARDWTEHAKTRGAGAVSRGSSVMQEEVAVDEDEALPGSTRPEGYGEVEDDDQQQQQQQQQPPQAQPAGSPSATQETHAVRRAPPSVDELLDEEHDLAGSLADEGPMVGGTRSSSFATRVMPRRLQSTKRWLRAAEEGEDDQPPSRASELAEAVSYEGMRRFEESTLFAKEAYKTHQFDEPGEGFVGTYVEPTLDGYDMAFQAYSSEPFVPRRERLSGNAPIHF
jgi:hypothetical protein